MQVDTIIQGDCLDELCSLDPESFDMILCDLPSGVTKNPWDSQISLDQLWQQYRRLIKRSGVICLMATQPYTTDLINAARDLFRYELIWEKSLATGFLNANRMPMRAHEDILIFYKNPPVYNPQKTQGNPPMHTASSGSRKNNCYGSVKKLDYGGETERHPRSVVKVNSVSRNSDEYLGHGTQKPVKLFEYLIKTYTNEGDLVLDNCIGSGTTAIAALNTRRHFIGIEKEAEYCEIARKRIAALPTRLDSFL